MQQLDAPSQRELTVQADLDIAQWSRVGSLMHFILLLVVAVASPYFHEHSRVMVAAAAAVFVVGVARFVVASVFAARYRKNPALWRFLFKAGTYAAAAVWGAFCCLTVAFYGDQWVSWFVLLITTGIAAGASNSLSPDNALARRYTVILLGPTVLYGSIRGGFGGYPIALVVGLYAGFLWIQGRRESEFYWQALNQRVLLGNKAAEVEERNAYLKALIEGSPLAFVMVDTEHRVQMCNVAFERLFQYQANEVIGSNINELIKVEDIASEIIGFQRFAEMGNAVHATTRRRRKDGTQVPVEIHVVPLVVEDKFIGLCALYQDVTERKRVEEQLQSALQMKSDFISFATHQLRTPLAGIKWLLELAAQDKKTSEETGSLVQDARESAERLIRMVNDLLDVSKLESGKLTLSPASTNLRELTQTVLKDVHSQLVAQKHDLSVCGGEDMPSVWIDAQWFRQVILNLVSNAVKYTPPGGKIRVDMSQRNSLIRWSIRDSGIGIPKRAQSQLFEKFFRADNVYAIETEGTGLGLYMVRLIMKNSGGRIWCESEEGKGSTFTFEIPSRGSC